MLPLLLLACRTVVPEPQLQTWGHVDVDAGAVSGLSGLAAGPDGTLWAVTERPPRLVQLDGGGSTILRTLPIEGLPGGVEPESVVVTASGAIWAGTEGPAPFRAQDLVVRLRISGAAATVVETLPVPWTLFGLEADGNKGLEGLCEAGGRLLVGGEPVDAGPDGRRAPLALYTDEGWLPYWLPLASEEGKLAALWCQATPDGAIELEAIERHYGVLHLVQARLEAGAPPDSAVDRLADLPLDPAVLAMDLNFEGLTRVGHRRLLLSDNQSGDAVKGPTRLVRVDVEPPEPPPQPNPPPPDDD